MNGSGIIIGICVPLLWRQVYAGEQMRKYGRQSMQANIDVMAIRAILLFLLSFFLETEEMRQFRSMNSPSMRCCLFSHLRICTCDEHMLTDNHISTSAVTFQA